MSRHALLLAYDGTEFAGWQRQERHRTVQGEVESALARLAGHPVVVHAAGRTDAGVHALGQVAHADLPELAPALRAPPSLRRRLNALLPPDLRVLAVVPVEESFHARRSALGKRYAYRIDLSPAGSPFTRRYRYHFTGRLDAGAMTAAAPRFEGRRDFASLRTAGSSVRTTLREVTRCRAVRDGDELTVEVEGAGFLRHMVRGLVGCLLEIGRRRRPPEWIDEVLEARDRTAAGANVPARGLFLQEVLYAPGTLTAPFAPLATPPGGGADAR